MNVHVVVKLKSSYEAWRELFANHAENRTKMCDESKTLVGKADDSTALVTLFNVDMEAMAEMMSNPEFQKLTEDYVEKHIPFTLSSIGK